MSKSTREKIDELGNEMLRNPNMNSRDIQANTLAILSSMYDESKRRHDEMSSCIKAVDSKMQIIVWVGGLIATAIILNIVANILKIPELKSLGIENQKQVEVINK